MSPCRSLCVLPNFVKTLAQKSIKATKRNFIWRYFILGLKAAWLVEIGPKVKKNGFKNLNSLSDLDEILHIGPCETI